MVGKRLSMTLSHPIHGESFASLCCNRWNPVLPSVGEPRVGPVKAGFRGAMLCFLFQATPGCELPGQWSPWEAHHPGEAGRCWTATSARGAASLGRLLAWSRFTGGPGGLESSLPWGCSILFSFFLGWGGGMSRGPTEAPWVSFHKAWIYFIPLNVSVFGKILWKRNGNPLWYSRLENPTGEPGGPQSVGSQRVGHD